MVKNLPASEGDAGDVSPNLGLGRSQRVRNGNPVQYSCLEDPWTEESGVLQFMGLQSRTGLSMHAGRYSAHQKHLPQQLFPIYFPSLTE